MRRVRAAPMVQPGELVVAESRAREERVVNGPIEAPVIERREEAVLGRRTERVEPHHLPNVPPPAPGRADRGVGR